MVEQGHDPGGAQGPGGACAVREQREEAGLASGLAELSQLVTGQLSLSVTLTRVAEFAVRAIPGADGAGLALLRDGHVEAVVGSADFVRQVDDVQHGIAEGPCFTAAAEGRTVVSGSLGGDAAFPRFGPRVSHLGVHSALSVPLLSPDGPIGAINVYAHARDAFDDRAVAFGQHYAAPAAVAVRNAHALAEARGVATRLQQALHSRATIDQAMGIVMSRTGATAEEAFAGLRAISQREGRKLVVIAQSVVDDAVRRTRDRRDPD